MYMYNINNSFVFGSYVHLHVSNRTQNDSNHMAVILKSDVTSLY